MYNSFDRSYIDVNLTHFCCVSCYIGSEPQLGTNENKAKSEDEVEFNRAGSKT